MSKVKIAFIGAGSTIFVRNIIGDCMVSGVLEGAEYALFDIDLVRLNESKMMLENIKKNVGAQCDIVEYSDRKEALKDAKYIVNAIQVGGYECTVTDFEVPKKYGLKQTISDTIGIGGIMRGLRTLKVIKGIACDIEEVCPDALFINYVNPMSIITGYLLRYTNVKTIGLCHSVQICTKYLLEDLGLNEKYEEHTYEIAGINHMGWLLKVNDKDGNDIYPEIKDKAYYYLENSDEYTNNHPDLTRFEMMRQFGYYITESSEHAAEYYPYFIKSKYPDLVGRYRIPIDEYIRRCNEQIDGWDKMKEEVVNDGNITHTRTNEYGSRIIEAMETGAPFEFGGNVINDGMITNLPDKACVEVKCIADSNGICKTYVGELPVQLAALNMTHINVHELVIQAFVQLKMDYVYHAALLDPHTSSELSIEEVRKMVDELIARHGDWMPTLI